MTNTKMIKNIKLSKIALATLFASSISATAYAETIAITHATIHTATEQGVLNDATVVFDEGKIIAINPKEIKADTIIDAQGKIVTPGLVGSVNQLGLVEVGAVSRTRDSSDKKADITFDASLAFNPKSTLIAYSRKGGITSNVVRPNGGENMFKGQNFVVNLSGDLSNSIVERGNSVFVDLGSESKGSRAYNLQALNNKFEDAEKALSKAKEKAKKAAKKKDKKDDKAEPSRDEKIINALLSGEKPLLAYADRATDILALLKLKEKFGLDLILLSAADAVVVKDEIAKANVPVIMGALDNLPGSFDSLHNSLKNSAILTKAGVKVILAKDDTHNLYQLRYDAGVAVANGMSKDDALATITANVADAFNLNSGRIAVGKSADIVMWSADPFEISTTVTTMWINGKEVSTYSRQDALRDRYMAETDMPRAYVK